MTERIALVTGASSGLGKEFVMQLDQEKDIDAFWVIARREELLKELSEHCTKPVKAIAMDLTESSSLDQLEAMLKEEQPVITWMVAAAGLGKIGRIMDQSRKEDDRMIQLNCQAAVDVTKLSLPYLKKGSHVVEISSIAAFQRMPSFAVYGASKAFLQSYTKALHYELIGTGIHVTCICPYWVKDTEFMKTADPGSQAKYYRHQPLKSTSKSVVKQSIRASKMNLWVWTPGIVTTADRFFAKFVPHCIMTPIMDLWSRL